MGCVCSCSRHNNKSLPHHRGDTKLPNSLIWPRLCTTVLCTHQSPWRCGRGNFFGLFEKLKFLPSQTNGSPTASRSCRYCCPNCCCTVVSAGLVSVLAIHSSRSQRKTLPKICGQLLYLVESSYFQERNSSALMVGECAGNTPMPITHRCFSVNMNLTRSLDTDVVCAVDVAGEYLLYLQQSYSLAVALLLKATVRIFLLFSRDGGPETSPPQSGGSRFLLTTRDKRAAIPMGCLFQLVPSYCSLCAAAR